LNLKSWQLPFPAKKENELTKIIKFIVNICIDRATLLHNVQYVNFVFNKSVQEMRLMQGTHLTTNLFISIIETGLAFLPIQKGTR